MRTANLRGRKVTNPYVLLLQLLKMTWFKTWVQIINKSRASTHHTTSTATAIPTINRIAPSTIVNIAPLTTNSIAPSSIDSIAPLTINSIAPLTTNSIVTTTW